MSQTINCSSCGAVNQLPEGKNSMFCAFCGNTIQNEAKILEPVKGKISKSQFVEAFIGGSLRGKKLSYIKRNIESIEEVIELYSDSEIEEIKDLILSNNSIKSLTGIERFHLNMLNLSGNQITIIDKLPRFDGTLIYTSYPMYVELDFSNNSDLTNFSDEAIYQIENPGYREIRNFVLNFNGCPKLNLDKFNNINFSKYSSDSEKAVLFIVLDPTIEFPEKLKEKGFQKSNNIFLSHFKNVWEYNKKQINTSKSKIESNGKCFIATATVGSYDHPEVMELRNFRDNWILEKKWGESFVKWYYHYGAKAAKVIEKSFVLKKISYFIIVKPLYILSKILNN